MTDFKTPVGGIRPSQLMFTYGVGAIIDLPKLSVIVTGLEDWPVDPQYNKTIVEDRLLTAVRYELPEVKRLLGPPIVPDTGLPPDPFDRTAAIGVAVANFPRWMVCPRCRLLAPLSDGLFKLKEYPGGEARDLEIFCESCETRRRLSQAFGEENREKLPLCSGRRPHLRDYDPDGCEHRVRPLILGASNTWFPVVQSTIAIPIESGRLAQLVDENWAQLQAVNAPNILQFMRSTGQLGELSEHHDDEIWTAIEERRAQDAGEAAVPGEAPDLKVPEWQVFTQHNPQLNGDDFRLIPVTVPPKFSSLLEQVVLVERLREVRAMMGFTRLDAMGELTDPDLNLPIDPSPLSRRPPTWVPADEVRGEGIFIQFNQARINTWLAQPEVHDRGRGFFESHKKWRQARWIEPPENGFPGMQYVLIHSFAHALMRQLALECGYAAASIRERLYVRPPEREGGPMAGVLIYTSAPDSEGTLGGLVSLGQPKTLERHISQALEAARLCASDPLCAERQPSQTGRTLHAAACHACLFAPETSCERGNKYLDRSTLIHTVERDDLAFFE